VVLFNALAHGHRFFIDDFDLHAECVGDMLREFYESLLVSAHCEQLRSKYLLNPLNDGDTMTHPVHTPVSCFFYHCYHHYYDCHHHHYYYCYCRFCLMLRHRVHGFANYCGCHDGGSLCHLFPSHLVSSRVLSS
jgi:hypothetical protein